MSDANALYETARRIASVAESHEEACTASGLMHQAAELGHGPAAGAYANMLMSGFGCGQDIEKAIHYWTLAALDGADADSAFRLGLICRDGQIAHEDMPLALAWFLIARDLGCDVVLPDIDEVQYQMNEGEAADAYLRYDELRASCEALR